VSTACSRCSRWCNGSDRPVMAREVGCGGAFRVGCAPRSDLTAVTPGWEMFPVGSRSAVVRMLCAMVERTVAVTGGVCRDDDRGAVAVGEGDAAAL
jgi:hypothetical protein